MRIEATTQDDFAFGLSPSAPNVTAVQVIEHLKLRVEFADGLVNSTWRQMPCTTPSNSIKNGCFSEQQHIPFGPRLRSRHWL